MPEIGVKLLLRFNHVRHNSCSTPPEWNNKSCFVSSFS